MKTLENLIKEWEKTLEELEKELDEKNNDEEYDDDHDLDNLEGHIERLQSDLLAVRGLL